MWKKNHCNNFTLQPKRKTCIHSLQHWRGSQPLTAWWAGDLDSLTLTLPVTSQKPSTGWHFSGEGIFGRFTFHQNFSTSQRISLGRKWRVQVKQVLFECVSKSRHQNELSLSQHSAASLWVSVVLLSKMAEMLGAISVDIQSVIVQRKYSSAWAFWEENV